jgi:hypothetical protein
MKFKCYTVQKKLELQNKNTFCIEQKFIFYQAKICFLSSKYSFYIEQKSFNIEHSIRTH